MADSFDPDEFAAFKSRAGGAPGFDPAEFAKSGGPKGSQLAALGEGAASGLHFGWNDEIGGTIAAGNTALGLGRDGGPQVAGAFSSVVPMAVGAADLLYERVKGVRGPATKAYEEKRDEMRARKKAAREEYPKTYIGGELAGGLLVPGGAVAKAATLPARLTRGALTGMTAGGLTGLGEGEGLSDSLERGGFGLVGGGVTGAVAPAAAAGIARAAAPIISRIAAPISNTARAVFSPRDEAARQVVTAIERDIKSDPGAATRLTPQEFIDSKAAGMPVAAADMGGGLTRRLADVAAIASPEAETALKGAINNRFETQSPRLASWLRETFNYPDAAAQQEAIDVAARAANKPAYARASAEAAKLHPQGLWDEGFEQLSQDPTVQAAIRKANITSRSAAARQGVTQGQPITPIRSPFAMDANGRMVLNVGPNGERARPTLQYWDEVKKNLDKVGSFEARSMARALRDHIDGLVPSYQAARAGAAHFFGAENALEAGQNFVGAGARYGIPAARRAISQMSAQERQLFQDGYVSRLVEKIEATGDRRSVLNQIMQSPAARAEINMAIGVDRSNQLEARLRVEGIMDLLRNAVTSNSWTARRLVDIGLATTGSGLVGAGGYNADPKEMATGAIMTALAGGRHRVNQSVMRHVAELLISGDVKQLAKGVRIVARNPRMLDALRAADQRIANSAAEQSGNLPAIQAGGISRAEDDQSGVKRPPGQ